MYLRLITIEVLMLLRVGSLFSKRDCLSVFFYNMRIVNLNLHESAFLVFNECLIFWRKTHILTQYCSNCIIKCKKLYQDLRSLEKHKTRTNELNKYEEITFNEDLNDLFDIAAANPFNLIKNKEDVAFLIFFNGGFFLVLRKTIF
jgi:aldehyde:ferredoxin oxidoreductase